MMTQLSKHLGLVAICCAALTLGVGCGKDDAKAGGGEDKASKPVPPKAANGSPISAKFVEFVQGKRPKIRVEMYNHGDKKAAGYVILAKFHDKDGKLLKVKPGTSFEKDFGFTSMSGGRKSMCEPKSHCTIDVWWPDIPEGAAKAEIVVSKVETVDSGGMQLKDWWTQQGGWSDWPSK